MDLLISSSFTLNSEPVFLFFAAAAAAFDFYLKGVHY